MIPQSVAGNVASVIVVETIFLWWCYFPGTSDQALTSCSYLFWPPQAICIPCSRAGSRKKFPLSFSIVRKALVATFRSPACYCCPLLCCLSWHPVLYSDSAITSKLGECPPVCISLSGRGWATAPYSPPPFTHTHTGSAPML